MMAPRVVVVTFGMGNVGSVVNTLKRLGVAAEVTSDPEVVQRADKLILPGVGAFDAAMRNLADLRLIEPLRQRALEDEVPVLGICLGMQLLAEHGDEGDVPGLGWIAGAVRRLQPVGEGGPLRVPHIGWASLTPRKPSPYLEGMAADARFYFVHSYAFECTNADDVLATATYGGSFVAAVERSNVAGMQFHPEKSGRDGLELLRRFVTA